jgi:urease alpha subunit
MIHFKFPDGTKKSAAAKVGENILDTVISNHLDIDGYGMLACYVGIDDVLRCSLQLAF